MSNTDQETNYSAPPQLAEQSTKKKESDKAAILIFFGLLIAGYGNACLFAYAPNITPNSLPLLIVGGLALTFPLLLGFARKLVQKGKPGYLALFIYLPFIGLILLCILCFNGDKPEKANSIESPTNYPRFEQSEPKSVDGSLLAASSSVREDRELPAPPDHSPPPT